MGTIPRRGGRESPPTVVGYDGCLVHRLERYRHVVRGLCPLASDCPLSLSLFPPLRKQLTIIVYSYFYFVCCFVLFFGYFSCGYTSCWSLASADTA